MTVTFGQGIADFHFFVDCEKAGTFKVQQLEFDTPTLTSSKISLVLGGGQGSKATIVDKMASTGFFPFLNADQIRSIYEIGICRYEQQFPIKPHIFYIKYDSYGIYSMTSFIRTLINHCSINVLLPLLNESNLLLPNDELFNNQFDQTLELFSNLLQFSIDVQKTFCQSSGFEVFSYLIQSKWPHYYNYKTYLQFYQLLENIKYQDLQRQMFINIILNFDILCKIDGDSHYRILRHWEHTLLPTCGSILKDIYNFKQLLSILRLYYWYEPREKGILFKDNRKPFNVDLCRKKIFNILMKYSDDCFNIDDFSLIISHIISCSDEKQIIDLISILISIIDLPNNEIHIQKDNVELMSYLTSLFTIQNQEIHLLTITLIFSLRSKLIISDEYIRRFIHGYMLVLPPNVISGELFNFCFDKREIFKEIYPLCCILAINLGGNYVGKLVNNLHKEFGWVWPMTFSTVADCDQKKQIYKFFAMNFDMVWEDIYLLFDIFFPDSDGEEKSLFLHAIGESILDSSHVSKPTSISSFFMLSKFCILYRKAKKTSSHFGNLFEVYDSDYSKNENLNNQKAFCYQSWNKRILNMEPNPEEYTFGLRFDCSGNWLDKKLAENVIQVYLKHSLPCYLDFILLLISYLYRVGYKDTFQVLSALQIPETWKNEHANYIQMTIYSTFMSNCQQFFKDEMNIDSSAIDTIYDDLIAQSSSEILQKYPRLVNNFKKLAKRREKTIANHLVVDFEKLCSKAIEQISDYRIKHKKKLKKYSTVWHRLYLLLSSDRAPWERKGSKPQFVRDINACFGFVPNKFARQNQVQLNEIFQPKLSNLILDISCDIFFPQTSMPAQFELSEENLNIRFESLRSFSFPLSAITHIFVCDKISIQLYTTIGTTVYMSFPQHNLNIVIEAFEKVTMKGLILFQKLQPFEYFKIQKITDFWSMGKISNYEYLLFLNTVCGRSFNLPDRYPLFPWIFNENGQIRDFSKTVTGTDKYSYSPMNRLIVERFFTNTILNENHVTNQINNQNSEKSIEFSTDGEAIPELYSMSELSSSEQLYAYRKIIESEEVSSEIHKWIKLIWSSGYTPGVEPLFSGDHIPRGKRIHVVDKSMTSHRIIRNKNIISAMIKEGEPKEYYVAIVTDDGILFESIFGDNYQSSKSTIPIINNVTDVVSIESLNQFAFLLKNSSTVSVLSMKPLSVLPVKYERISAISADGSFLVIGSENAIEFVFRNGQLMHYSQLYRDAIISCAVSSSSHIIVSGIKDGTIIISSLVTGTTVHVIDIFPRIPRKIIVSPSWGFITVYCTETTPGSLKKILLIYTVNGKLIRQMEIDFQISFWYAWKSYSCFDYLAMASANGDVYFCENFYIDSIRQVLVGNSPIKAMHYSNETSLLSLVQADGAFVNIPVVF